MAPLTEDLQRKREAILRSMLAKKSPQPELGQITPAAAPLTRKIQTHNIKDQIQHQSGSNTQMLLRQTTSVIPQKETKYSNSKIPWHIHSTQHTDKIIEHPVVRKSEITKSKKLLKKANISVQNPSLANTAQKKSLSNNLFIKKEHIEDSKSCEPKQLPLKALKIEVQAQLLTLSRLGYNFEDIPTHSGCNPLFLQNCLSEFHLKRQNMFRGLVIPRGLQDSPENLSNTLTAPSLLGTDADIDNDDSSEQTIEHSQPDSTTPTPIPTKPNGYEDSITTIETEERPPKRIKIIQKSEESIPPLKEPKPNSIVAQDKPIKPNANLVQNLKILTLRFKLDVNKLLQPLKNDTIKTFRKEDFESIQKINRDMQNQFSSWINTVNDISDRYSTPLQVFTGGEMVSQNVDVSKDSPQIMNNMSQEQVSKTASTVIGHEDKQKLTNSRSNVSTYIQPQGDKHSHSFARNPNAGNRQIGRVRYRSKD
ncbi:hypothetical protein TBLA_0B07990 [Henningerozyma blattae CBS 6284]|uniref:Uncharacterized protein n=1 Tax=Henningerozyma blattae (strain ATCC 34711 / CBS 6284 / DSM 70876 / NBRC 10599 / NRRL Y-10934 / UCD 77-7) TaxID=1071380 RepID=I2GZR3_HENB6|nr:hypothetical protein TBLA_0B07990 [Tetrapisispora blattae CBS 6284]CCH59615.1 hypothetical protein TBLA_0B07990 [Tetrapisispora blattae CBS 6284]